MNVDGIEFPTTAVQYLMKRKGVLRVSDEKLTEICRTQITRAHKQLAVRGFAQLLAAIPKPASVLDIGCGLGMIDVLMVQECGVHTVHLFDGAGDNLIWTGFKQDGQPWNDVRTAGKMVRTNVPSSVQVHEHVADPSLTIPVDLIVSFKSWGVHYPIATYLELADRSLLNGGFIATHIDDPDGVMVLQDAGFILVEKAGKRLHLFKKGYFL